MLALDRTIENVLLSLMLGPNVVMLEAAKACELRRCKIRWCARLKWAAQEQLRRK